MAAEDTAPTPKKKKSLFSKKIIAKLGEAEEGLDFFSRSQEVFPQQLEEEERRRQKKAAKLERRRSSTSAEKEPSPHAEKKRRVSNDPFSDEETETPLVRGESINFTPASRTSRSVSRTTASPTSLSARYSEALRSEKEKETDIKPDTRNLISLSDSDHEEVRPRPQTQPILLDDDDDDVQIIPSKSKQMEADPIDSDEEFPELLAQAREREKLREEQRQKASKSFANQNHASNADDDIFKPEPIVMDPKVELLITSKIERTKPLLVKRLLSQPLRPVRMAWIDYQESGTLEPHLKDSIFLTWKGTHLYDFTTCKSFGLDIDTQGQISSQIDGVDPNGRIHLEAWTQDTLEAYERLEEARKKREETGLVDEEELVEDKNVITKMRLILRSREYGDFKVAAKATTLIQKLINAFRQDKGVPDEKDIALHFDGDKLDPESKIADHELDKEDIVEVHIR